MTRIGLLSDSHSYFDKSLPEVFSSCDQVWHAGDFGNIEVYQQILELKKSLIAVHGNIDGNDIRSIIPADYTWTVEEIKIYMIHIGGYPGKYPARIKNLLLEEKPGIFVCGHSHILKVMYDKSLNLLHLNPGACGREGFHKVRTVLRFNIDKDKVTDMEVVELGLR